MISVLQILAQDILTPHADVRVADFGAAEMVGSLTAPGSRIGSIIDSHIGARRRPRSKTMTNTKTTRSSTTTRIKPAGGCSCDSSEHEAQEELHRGCERCGVVSRLVRSWQVAE